MKKAAGKTWVKVICTFLAALFAVAGILSTLVVASVASNDGYSQKNQNKFIDSCFRAVMYSDLSDINNYYILTSTSNNDNEIKYYEEKYSQDNTNLSFTVIDQSGKVLLTNFSATEPLATCEYTGFINQDSADMEYTIKAALKSSLDVSDKYKTTYQFATTAYEYRNMAIVVMCVNWVLFLGMITFLTYAAGRREGTDEISLRWIDRIPTDLFAFIALIAVTVCIAPFDGMSLSFYESPTFMLLFLAALAAAFGVLLIIFCMSIAVRIRTKTLWRNTLINKLLIWLKKPIGAILTLIKSVPLVWKASVAALSILILEFVSMGSGAVWLIVNISLALVIIASALEIRQLREDAKALADGDFEKRVDTSKLHGDFKAHGDDLNRIGDGISLAVEKQMRSERMKTELITNVSHDIKTPLTSILNYVDLLKKEDIQPDKAKEYVTVLERQSARLRKLTEDVIEASKAATGNIPVDFAATDVNVLLSQAVGEYEDKLTEQRLEPIVQLSDQPLNIQADGRLLWRVFDNLMGNVVKYAMPGTRVYISSALVGDRVAVTFKNISGAPLNITEDELMERFVRGDASRNTQGSGLGLSIAQSLTQLQHGEFSIAIDGDLFKAIVTFAEDK